MADDEHDEAIAELARLGAYLDEALRDLRADELPNGVRKTWIVLRTDPVTYEQRIIGRPQETSAAARMLAVRATVVDRIPAAQLHVVMVAW